MGPQYPESSTDDARAGETEPPSQLKFPPETDDLSSDDPELRTKDMSEGSVTVTLLCNSVTFKEVLMTSPA